MDAKTKFEEWRDQEGGSAKPGRRNGKTLGGEGELNDGSDRLLTDSIHLLNIFPTEVWMMILDNLKDTNDLENLGYASVLFRNLLQNKLMPLQLPKVLGILVAQYHKKWRSDKSFNEAVSDKSISNCCGEYPKPEHRLKPWEDCGKLHGMKWYSGILRLRLVSKTWCGIIDQLFQEQPHHYDWSDEPRGSDFDSRLGYWIKYSLTADNQYRADFHEHFDGTHAVRVRLNDRSPFLNRSVSISYTYIGIIPQFVEEMRTFLLAYGHHLWFCTFNISNYPGLAEAYSMLILPILRLMPNLKVLCLHYPPSPNDYGVYANDRQGRLRTVISWYTMPTFQNLQFLKVNRLSSLISNELIRANRHVSMLEIGWNSPANLRSSIYSVGMPNLRNLKLEIESEADFERLESSPFANWTLNKLYLGLNYCSHISLGRVFTLLEDKWSLSLTELILDVQRVDEESRDGRLVEFEFFVLNLPNLNRLELLIPGFFTLDFILPMKDNLERLYVTFPFQGDFNRRMNQRLALDAEKDRQIKVFSCGGPPVNSNIWTIFTKLKQFTFNKSVDSGGRKCQVKQWSCDRPRRNAEINGNQ